MYKIALSLYEGLWILLLGLLRAATVFSRKLQDQLALREGALEKLQPWAKERARFPRSVVFICSSAGEYEQAKPLIARLKARGDCSLFILFFSPSGLKFAQSQKEVTPYLLIPSDKPTFWREVAVALRPTAFVCVRYELWPGMVHVCKRYAPIYLVDGVEAAHLRKKRWARKVRSWLLKPMRKSFVVRAQDQSFFHEVLDIDSSRVLITGDTKYDRVLERISERSEALARLKEQLKGFLHGRRIIVLGSAWPRDLQEFASIFRQLKAFDPKAAVIIAPHDLSASNVDGMLVTLRDLNVNLCRVSTEGYAAAHSGHDVLFVDTLGDLPELYGCAQLAWVGGALHFRVHNVLEPACRGLYLCFGPHFQTSGEAVSLVEQGLARVIHNGPEFFQWYKILSWDTEPPHQVLWQAVIEQKGASDRIIQEISTSWQSQPALATT